MMSACSQESNHRAPKLQYRVNSADVCVKPPREGELIIGQLGKDSLIGRCM